MGHALQRFRTAKRLSREAIAKAVGTTRQTIHRIENGEQQPSWDLASRLIAISEGALKADDFMPAVAEQRPAA